MEEEDEPPPVVAAREKLWGEILERSFSTHSLNNGVDEGMQRKKRLLSRTWSNGDIVASVNDVGIQANGPQWSHGWKRDDDCTSTP